MTLERARSAGFCFGVRRAVETAELALQAGPCCCLGELIHNSAVVDRLAQKGLRTITAPEELPEGERVVLRSHGVSRDTLQRLKARNAVILDATCPRVSRIHRLVEAAEAAGRLPVVIGAAEHPEILAIRGWCRESLVFSGAAELEEWLSKDPENPGKPITVVFQTTQTQENLISCKNLIKNVCTNSEIFDTICGATFTRQQEALELARRVDAMVVIGGRHSANSRHLAELCRSVCPRVYFIETASELDRTDWRGIQKVGITAGASTPAWIIKEVETKMCDEIKVEETVQPVPEETVAPVTEEQAAPAAPAAEEAAAPAKPEGEKSFDELLEDSIKTIYNGDTVSGVVVAITPTEVSLDLGTKHSGFIPVSEFTDDGTDINDAVKVGDTIEAVAVRVNDMEGTVMLSKRRLDAVRFWSDIEAAAENGNIVEGKVTEENKGGVVVNVNGIRVFVPASQTGLPKGTELSQLVKQTVRLKLTEVNRGRRRVVGSIRAALNQERKERAAKIWDEIEVGSRYHGVVKSMTSYGAFVDIGGIDGMVHVSELSWSRINQPSDILKVGDEIDVYVINFDKEKKKISLGHKDPNENPWKRFLDTYKVGDVANVRIVKLMDFGAFAEVVPGVDGLIHISQIANRRIGKPDEVLTVGDMVDVKITNIDMDKHKISLSIRALSEPAPAPKPVVEEAAPAYHEPESDALVYEISADGQATGVIPDED